MKKFIFMIMAALAMTVNATAQTVESGNNWFVGLNVGAAAPLNHAFDWGNHGLQEYHALIGAEVGAYVTPVVGFSASGEGFINTTGANRWIDQSNVMANLKINLSNLLLGYVGEPRRVEFVVSPAMGWGHNYGKIDGFSVVDNFLTTKVGGEVNINLGAEKKWQLTVRPAVVWGNWGKHGLDSREAEFQVSAGIVYKFNSKKNAQKSHNFILVQPQTIEVTREVPVEKVVEKTVEVEKVVTKTAPQTVYVVSFAKDSSELDSDAQNVLLAIPSGTNVAIEATASPEGTADHNQTLSQNRADAVKAFVEAHGVKVASADGKGVTGATSQRIAKVIVK